MPAPHPGQRAARRRRQHALSGRPLPLLTRPWFWACAVGLLFCLPLLKSLTRDLPPELPGKDTPPLHFELPDLQGNPVTRESLAGRPAIVMALPLANRVERDAGFESLIRLRKRLRGLDKSVLFVVLAVGSDTASLREMLAARIGYKPVHVYLWDRDGATREELFRRAGSVSAEYLLLDRHGRVRGVYGRDEAERDRLVEQTGQLANWESQDPPP